MLRTGRPWTIGILIDLFFSTGAFQQNTQNLLSLIIEEKQFCQFWEQTQGTLLQQRRRTACGTAAWDFWKHLQQLWLPGLPQALLKPAHLCSEPHKMRSQTCLGWREKLILSFFTEEKRNCVSQCLAKERIMWREQSSLHVLQPFTGYKLVTAFTAGIWFLFKSFHGILGTSDNSDIKSYKRKKSRKTVHVYLMFHLLKVISKHREIGIEASSPMTSHSLNQPWYQPLQIPTLLGNQRGRCGIATAAQSYRIHPILQKMKGMCKNHKCHSVL